MSCQNQSKTASNESARNETRPISPTSTAEEVLYSAVGQDPYGHEVSFKSPINMDAPDLPYDGDAAVSKWRNCDQLQVNYNNHSSALYPACIMPMGPLEVSDFQRIEAVLLRDGFVTFNKYEFVPSNKRYEVDYDENFYLQTHKIDKYIHLSEAGGHSFITLGHRELRGIDFQNRFKSQIINSSGFVEVENISIKFRYQILADFPGLQDSIATLSGSASAYFDPADAKWKLTQLELPVQGETKTRLTEIDVLAQNIGPVEGQRNVDATYTLYGNTKSGTDAAQPKQVETPSQASSSDQGARFWLIPQPSLTQSELEDLQKRLSSAPEILSARYVFSTDSSSDASDHFEIMLRPGISPDSVMAQFQSWIGVQSLSLPQASKGASLNNSSPIPDIYWTQGGMPSIWGRKRDSVPHEYFNFHDFEYPMPDKSVEFTSPVGIAVDSAEGKMYWATAGYKVYRSEGTISIPGKIQRSNLDGSKVEDVVISQSKSESPFGIALDLTERKMYWTDDSLKMIRRANLNGTGVEDLVTSVNGPKGIALDVHDGKMYWLDETSPCDTKIQRANFNGTGVEDLITSGVGCSRWIALDVSGQKMYLSGLYEIKRADFDGSNVEVLLKLKLQSGSGGIAIDSSAAKMYWGARDKIQRSNLDGSNVEDVIPLANDNDGDYSLGIALVL
jgi:hypothetical protein